MYRLEKLKSALADLHYNMPEGWRWELTVWKDNGERWKLNPAGAYDDTPSSNIDIGAIAVRDCE